MSVNGVTGASDVYSSYATQSSVATNTKAAEPAEKTEAKAEVGAVYEPSDNATKDRHVSKSFANPELVAQLKSDAEQRSSQLQSLVEKLMSKQAKAFGDATDIWQVLREGKLEVDPATRAQAQEDISEDGYWGVNKTSDRILDFAQALAGDDPEALEKMRDAFKKGYAQAEKTWGGKLPEISQKTFDAVMNKFDDLIAKINGTVTE